ncbi:peptidylprolyl isomerase [Dysosmobacter sp.]|uniref:peptidylprolyl isomerase n=1 Tax=Dysosmobacter sp. TaxID=2591382 RepID=UPI002A94EEC6|nr:peptidylprolyl isomerase [Dysosmobacter sp.]MCI6053831.1 peptidyl-prolyl cis-trans isomerase [Dysosmobacter sp.]MDY5510807.1 peptidyl-prolyl cis-trans isomerase [Dysosmobacter sp.]
MRRIITAALACALLLTLAACGGKGTPPGDDLLSRASGTPSDEPGLTVDGREVEAWRYLYWLAYTCDSIQTAYDDAGTELDWDAAFGEGTLADYAAEQALADTVLYAVVENMAEDQDCALTEEDRAAMEADWTAAAEAAGGEDAYLTDLGRLGLDRTRAETLAATAYLYDRLRQSAGDPESGAYPTAEDLAAFGADSGYLTLDFIRVDAGDDAEAARARAGEAFSKLNGSAAPENDFAVLAATYSDDPDRDQYPHGRTFRAGEGTLPAAAEEAALDLEEGQWSGIVEADGSFYILLRLPLDASATAAEWFDWRLQSAAEAAEVMWTSTLEDLDAGEFWSALMDAEDAPQT